jgi:adenosylcobinamide kinase/adenosylcobinamide-phosphate guanylyltransferase
MILILGGVKSGKSSFASRTALEREILGPVAYLATARADDEEMAERIRRHRADRPDSWITVEEPENPAGYFEKITGGTSAHGALSTVLFDCLTLWLTNLLAPMGDEPDREEAMNLGGTESRRLLEAMLRWENGDAAGKEYETHAESPALNGISAPRRTLVVSNLVETGLISPWPLGRVFQDLAGLTHQYFASRAEAVYLMTAGLPQKIK